MNVSDAWNKSFSSSTTKPGFMDRMRQGLEDQRKGKERQAFGKQVQAFLESPTFTIDTFKKQLEDGIKEGGWKMKIPGQNRKQMEQMQKQIDVLNLFTDRERQNDNRIDGKVRKRVADASGLEVNEINYMLKQFRMMRSIHKWLTRRDREGKTMPETMDEAIELAMRDPRGLERPRYRSRN